ncbi:MAG: hypothetical protein K8I29_12625 [Alphaproteobacteria bacterium]|uniref:Uncharacterized protein n=1 Tax=Candidatus Nitrobium versatile TaxID=2884831 RepID=A0A953JFU4_9BACT|nr:hypothetical protein [Candidatus Nitrobium versatile]
MKAIIWIIALLMAFLPAVPLRAELDLEQEVLIIPDTHNEKPYIWNVAVNPKGYTLHLEPGGITAGTETVFRFSIASKAPDTVDALHVFITDHDLHTFQHLRPVRESNGYVFPYTAPRSGLYRVEVVFRTPKGWINLRKDIRASGKESAEKEKKAGDDDYQIEVKLIPKKIYADHVGTLLFTLSHKGSPVKDLEKVEGADMQVAVWDKEMEEFVYATPKQNLGGPQVAVSIVFTEPGTHAVFAEFRHKGVTRRVELSLPVYFEPQHLFGSSESSGPAWW